MKGFTLNKEPLPNIITYEWLMSHDACSEAETFREMYPDGTEITEEVIGKLLEEKMDLDFLIRAAYGIYEDDKLREKLHKKTGRAFKNYTEEMKLIDAIVLAPLLRPAVIHAELVDSASLYSLHSRCVPAIRSVQI